MVDISSIRIQEGPIKDRIRKAQARKEQSEQVRDEIRRENTLKVDVKLFQGEAQRIENSRNGGRIKLGW